MWNIESRTLIKFLGKEGDQLADCFGAFCIYRGKYFFSSVEALVYRYEKCKSFFTAMQNKHTPCYISIWVKLLIHVKLLTEMYNTSTI